MISRPMVSKELKCNGKLYKLEMWGSQYEDDDPPADDFFLNKDDGLNSDYSQNPKMRKDFFNEVDMSGSWTPASTSKYTESFQLWFDKLPVDKQREYVKSIDESNRIIISMVWDIINEVDKQELFNNNLRQFSNWFTALDVKSIDLYMSRIMSKRRLMPKEFQSEPSMLSEEQVTFMLQEVYDSIDDDLVRATSINGLLCISCTDEDRLKKAKKHMVRHGSILRDYRKKENANGRLIYTYIFSKP